MILTEIESIRLIGRIKFIKIYDKSKIRVKSLGQLLSNLYTSNNYLYILDRVIPQLVGLMKPPLSYCPWQINSNTGMFPGMENQYG